MSGREIIRWFSPRWFIAVMGTGAIANVLQLLAGQPHGFLHGLAVGFLLLAVGLYPLVAAVMVARVTVGFDCIMKEMRHSSLIQFYAAISIAAAVCATGLLNIPVSFIPPGLAYVGALVFWWVAAVTGVFFIVLIPYMVIIGIHAEPRRALGFWFLPPVGLFVLVFAGNFLSSRLHDAAMLRALLCFNMLTLGVAVFLTIAIYTLFIHRALFHNFPRRDVVPSFMIGVAPVGVSIIALHTLLPLLAAAAPTLLDLALVTGLIKAVTILLWGFGFWWLLVASALITYTFVTQGIPVTLGYWAFIFPPAAFTIATLVLARALELPGLRSVAAVLTVLLLLAWTVTALLTVRGMITRSIFAIAPTFKGDIPYL